MFIMPFSILRSKDLKTKNHFILKASSSQPSSEEKNQTLEPKNQIVQTSKKTESSREIIQRETLERKLLKLPGLSFRQLYRSWRVSPPSFGKTTGLTIIFEGEKGTKIYINTAPYVKVCTSINTTGTNEGKDTYYLQEEVNTAYLRKMTAYQKAKDPQSPLKVTLRFLRVNHQAGTAMVFQKLFRVNTIIESGDLEVGELLEQSAILLSKEQFVDPFYHIKESADVLQVNQGGMEEDNDI